MKIYFASHSSVCRYALRPGGRLPAAPFGQQQQRFAVLGVPLAVGLTANVKRQVGYWMLGCAGMVFGAVVLGGVTRLTESGLSMVSWRLHGEMPPFSEASWAKEFERYKKYPEYHYKSANREMSIGEFKFIWTMEWVHRMWGRLIGMVFFIPAVYFWRKGYFTAPMQKRVIFAGALLLFQGLLGWYMVKSGLNPKGNSQSDIPRVSQYRLAAHLSAAVVLYSVFLWCGLSHAFSQHRVEHVRGIAALRGLAHFSKTSIFLTIVAGAFVAGLDAGMIYNTWPTFSGRWIPSDLWHERLGWRNFTENTTCVQFTHRLLGYLSLISVAATWLIGRRLYLPSRALKVLNVLLAVGCLQVFLGIAALLKHVPVALGTLHQSGSMALLTTALTFTHQLRRFVR